LAEALQEGNQARAELSLQQKLRADVQLRMEELEESVLEKDQELLRLTQIVSRLQGESEQMQMKLIQEKDLNDQLECEKAILERQLRDLRREMEELQNNRVEVDSITRAEIKAKELENTLRAEERSKVVMSNTISKLEKKIHELTEQMEEEHKISTEQREL
ncbi:hypothetical protein cypCar_00049262, partial [Cyprinus carpio]